MAEDEAPPPNAYEARPPAPLEIVPLNGSGPSVRHLATRLRWSDRGVFRIPRLVAGWSVGLAVFWAAVWMIVR